MANANTQSTNLEWPTTATLGLATLLITTTLSVVGWFIQKRFTHAANVGGTSDQTTSHGNSSQMSVMERGQIGEDHHEDERNDTTPAEAATIQPEQTANHQLQLLRPTHEEIECGTWTDCTKFIPVTKKTKKDEGLDALDINEDNHPSFMRPPYEGCVGRICDE
ncbi:hypothetical protein BJ166DRAFT_536935 [Pestalotiopsis sp. NC0098]|nr:hypothetical protein BJ166DRAFT_536935 [Pestalotiopsis sp. NC0098]